MEKYKKYLGIVIFCVLTVIVVMSCYNVILPKFQESMSYADKVRQSQENIDKLQRDLQVVQTKIQKIKNSIVTAQKKIYSPVESDIGSETLFFTLYNDVIDMLHANHIKIRTINYEYNPENDKFVTEGKGAYFVSDVNMQLVSNYTDLGKLIENIYQYPYYIRINEIDVKPYEKDKKILLSTLSLRLYARLEPEEEAPASNTPALPALDGANTALPQ